MLSLLCQFFFFWYFSLPKTWSGLGTSAASSSFSAERKNCPWWPFFGCLFPFKLPLLIDFSCCPARFSVKKTRQRGFCVPSFHARKVSRKVWKSPFFRDQKHQRWYLRRSLGSRRKWNAIPELKNNYYLERVSFSTFWWSLTLSSIWLMETRGQA